MEFKIQVARLRHAFALLEPAIPRKATLDTLKCVRLGDGQAVASDLDTTVVVELPEIREVEGACLLPYKVVRDLLRFTPGSASMTLVPRDGKVHMYTQGTQASFAAKDPGEYPPPPKIGEAAMGSLVDGDDLVGTLSALVQYTATEESRPVLTAVCLTLLEPMEAAAADGFRLAVRTLRSGFHGGEGRRMLLHRDTVRLLQKLWKLAPPPSDAPEGSPIAEVVVARRPVWMECDPSQVQFRFGDVTVVSKVVEGTFPNYRQLIPTGHTSRVTVFGADLERAVRQVGSVAEDGGGIVRLAWEGERMTVSGKAIEVGDVEVALKAQAESPGHIAFNMAYLQSYLKGKEGPVAISMTEPSAPGVLTYQGVSVVIMPMLVKDDSPKAAEPPPAGDDVSTEAVETPLEGPDPDEAEQEAVQAVERAKPKRRRRKKQDPD